MRDDDIDALEELQESGEDDIYNEEALEEEIEDDEIDALEEGFMKGYDREAVLRCDQCGNELGDKFHRLEMEERVFRFCSKQCKEDFQDQLI